VRVSTIRSILNNYETLLSSFDEMIGMGGDLAAKARGMHAVMTKGAFIYGLLCCEQIFSPLEEVSRQLQAVNNSAAQTKAQIQFLCNVLTEMRSSFSKLWAESLLRIQTYGLDTIVLPCQRNRPVRYEDDIAADVLPLEQHYRRDFGEFM